MREALGQHRARHADVFCQLFQAPRVSGALVQLLQGPADLLIASDCRATCKVPEFEKEKQEWLSKSLGTPPPHFALSLQNRG